MILKAEFEIRTNLWNGYYVISQTDQLQNIYLTPNQMRQLIKDMENTLTEENIWHKGNSYGDIR